MKQILCISFSVSSPSSCSKVPGRIIHQYLHTWFLIITSHYYWKNQWNGCCLVEEEGAITHDPLGWWQWWIHQDRSVYCERHGWFEFLTAIVDGKQDNFDVRIMNNHTKSHAFNIWMLLTSIIVASSAQILSAFLMQRMSILGSISEKPPAAGLTLSFVQHQLTFLL